MSRKLLPVTTAAVAAAAVALIAATAVGAAGATQGARPAHAAKLSPVLIHETFTPLPCSGKPGHRTTLEQEGCAEHQILRSDAQINSLAKSVFGLLHDDRARRDFNAAQRAWLNYRKTDCLSMSDVFEGGTQAGVVDAQCVASRNNQRVKDLRGFRRDLSATG